MPDPDPDDTPPPAGPFYSISGPLDGPILSLDGAPALAIVAAPESFWPIGTALPVGLTEHHKGSATTFRLVVGKKKREGTWICVARQFIQLGEAAEDR